MSFSRREVFKGAITLGIGATLTPKPIQGSPCEPMQEKRDSMHGVPFPKIDNVRAGIIGLGARGSSLLPLLLALDGVSVVVLCDLDESAVGKASRVVEETGQKTPALYFKGEKDYENLFSNEKLDLVLIATPWQWHVPMAVCAMENGCITAVEVPAATTIEDCWKLIRTSEKTRQHCLMLENCCYGYNERLALNMIRDGRLGTLLHAEGAYIHDLRSTLISDASEGLWRRAPHLNRNGNLYPTHGLGPLARYFDIPNEDQFDFLVSLSSREAGLSEYVKDHVEEKNPKRQERYLCGDINISLIRTKKGRTILLQHQIVSPRPYDRNNLVSGTRGIFRDYPPRIYLDGQGNDDWQSLDPFIGKYEDPLWRKMGELAKNLGGHGGMDFLMLYRLVQSFHEGSVPDMDVYDAAILSSPGPLSEASVASGGAPQKVPDFLCNKR